MPYQPEIAWETYAIDVQNSSTGTHYYYLTVESINPNDYGVNQKAVGDYFIDYLGFVYEITQINVGADSKRIEVFEITQGTVYAQGITKPPYPNANGFVYRPLNDAVILTQAQLRRLHGSAKDIIQPIEKGVIWDHDFWEANVNDIYNLNTGNVGIGTSSPGGKLSINSLTGDNLRLGYNDSYYWTVERTAQGDFNVFTTENDIPSSSIFFIENVDSRIGIGTETPGSKLHINGGVGTLSTGLSFGDGDTGIYEIIDDQLSLTVGGVDGIKVNSSTAHSVSGIVNYETLVIADDDIPNKKYVDDAIGIGTSEYVVRQVTQVTHGFNKDFIYYNGTSWVKAIASSASTCATHFAINIDVNTFELVPVGEIDSTGMTDSASAALVAGQYYFLDQSVAGKVIGTKPSIGIIQSVLIANEANEASVSIQEPYDIDDTGGGSGSGITSPLIAKGDIWIYSTQDTRLPIGINDYVLTADSTESNGMKWAALPTYSNETITLSGDATGSGTTSIVVTVVDDSHNHSNYLLNNASDSTTGTLTAAGFTTTGDISANNIVGNSVIGDNLVNVNKGTYVIATPGWWQVAETAGGDHAMAIISIIGYDGGDHTSQKFIVSFNHGQGNITQIAGSKYFGAEVTDVRLVYNTADRTYGGARFEIYCYQVATVSIIVEDYNVSNWYSEWILLSTQAQAAGWTAFQTLSNTHLSALQTTTEIYSANGNSTQWDTAYTHSQDNSQAHSDYLINNGSDSTTGSLTAVSFIRTGGSSTQFLKADGTVDSNVYALDSAVVHDTGDETIAGIKTFSSFPITPSSAPTTNYQVANKKYVDDLLTDTAFIGSVTLTYSDTLNIDTDSAGSPGSKGLIIYNTHQGEASADDSGALLRFRNNGSDVDSPNDGWISFIGETVNDYSKFKFKVFDGVSFTTLLEMGYGSSGKYVTIPNSGLNVNGLIEGTSLTVSGLGSFGSFDIDGIVLNDSTDRSGLLEINRLGATAYSGMQIDFTSTAKWSVMGNQTVFGLYDDYNSKWALLHNESGAINLYHNGASKIQTLSSGANITGSLGINDSSPSYNLDVTGNGRFTGSLTVGTLIASTLDVTDTALSFTGTSWASFSSVSANGRTNGNVHSVTVTLYASNSSSTVQYVKTISGYRSPGYSVYFSAGMVPVSNNEINYGVILTNGNIMLAPGKSNTYYYFTVTWVA